MLCLSLTGLWYARASCSESQRDCSGSSICRLRADVFRSIRASGSGYPLLNLDIGFSAFLASGPAIEVISKMLSQRGGTRGGRGGFGGRGGNMGGMQREIQISEMDQREIALVKNKLRGAKVSCSTDCVSQTADLPSSPFHIASPLDFTLSRVSLCRPLRRSPLSSTVRTVTAISGSRSQNTSARTTTSRLQSPVYLAYR